MLKVVSIPVCATCCVYSMKFRCLLGACFQSAVQPVESKADQLSLKPRTKFDPLDWTDPSDEQSEPLQLPM